MAEQMIDNPYRSELEQIERERLAMLDSGRLSLLPAVGRLAIFVSGTDGKGRRSNEDYPEFMEEAEAFQAEQAGRYAEARIIEHVGKAAITAALRDPEVSGVAYIGHGSLPTFYTEEGMINWHDTWQSRNYLKHEVWQASCGHIPSLWIYGIPYGMPVMSKPSGLRAAVGAIIPDHAVSYDNLLHPVFTDEGNIIDQLDVINTMHHGHKVILDGEGKVTQTKSC